MDKLEKLKDIDKRYRIFGMFFLLSTKLETIGNTFLNELTTKQWFFMLVLTSFFETPPTLTELANHMGTSHQNAKQLALKIQEKGFLTMEKDKEDHRVLRIIPTEKIQEYVKIREDMDQKFIDEFFKVLTNGEIKELDNTLFKLIDNIQNIEERS